MENEAQSPTQNTAQPPAQPPAQPEAQNTGHPEAQNTAQPEAQPEEPQEGPPEEPEEYNDSLPGTFYDVGKISQKKIECLILMILQIGATIFGGYINFCNKKSHATKLYYEYCMVNNINYKRNFNNRRCHPESILRMSTPFQNGGDIDMYIKEKDLEELMEYFNNNYIVEEQSAKCSYFIPEKTRNELKYKSIVLKPKIDKSTQKFLNQLYGVETTKKIFPFIFIDLIIIKNSSLIRPPFNCPDFICNQLFMYWSTVENRVIISVNSNHFQTHLHLSHIDTQTSINNTLALINQQCIDNIAELYPEVIPPLHRVLKMLLKGYTIKIPKDTIPGAIGHKFEIPEGEKKNNKCVICYDNFKEGSTIMHPCNQCSNAYHIDCYIAYHLNSVTTHNKIPDCPLCNNILTTDHCDFVNMVYLIHNYNEYVKTKNYNYLTKLRFKYCNECSLNSPTPTLPHKINYRTLKSIIYKSINQ